MKKKKKKFIRPRLRAKLSFDEGFAEMPLYSIKAFTSEKEKGIDMIELIKTNFNINGGDMDLAFKKKMEEWQEEAMKPTELSIEARRTQVKIKWTRDENGNLISPFSNKAKELREKESQS